MRTGWLGCGWLGDPIDVLGLGTLLAEQGINVCMYNNFSSAQDFLGNLRTLRVYCIGILFVMQ